MIFLAHDIIGKTGEKNKRSGRVIQDRDRKKQKDRKKQEKKARNQQRKRERKRNKKREKNISNKTNHKKHLFYSNF